MVDGSPGRPTPGGEGVEEEPPSTSTPGPGGLLPLCRRKARRPSSPFKTACGDHAALALLPSVAKALIKYGDTSILFSEAVLKVNREGRLKPKVLLITERHVFTLNSETKRVSRKIPHEDVACVCMSTLADNFILIKVAQDVDLLLDCVHKAEALAVLQGLHQEVAGAPLEVVMEDRFDNRFSQTLVRTVEFASVATDAGRHCVCRLGNMRTLTAPPPA